MYHRYFGLNEEPFSIAVNPRYLFMSARHRDALAHLIYGVGVGGGFILLTGEVGTGKTTINRCLLEQLPENTDIALILNPALNATELLATVCDEFSIGYPDGKQSLKVLTDKLHQFLLNNHAEGRNTVLLIDEAQHLQFDVLEQIRLLTNLETNTKKLLQIILVGQPELRTLLNKPELRQLAQRITARYQLKPLNLEETHAYIRHRLQIAGLPANQELFPKSIVKGIHKITRGVPRIINVLCDRMLLGAYGQNKATIDRPIFKQAIIEVMGEEEDIQLPLSNKKFVFMAGLVSVVILAIIISFWLNKNVSTKAQITSSSPPITSLQINEPQTLNTPVTTAKIPEAVLNENRDNYFYTTQQQAIDALITSLGLAGKLNPRACLSTEQTSPRCEQVKVASWQELISYNRPAVLSLITASRMQVYASLLSIDNNMAIIQYNNQVFPIGLTELGKLWTGEFVFIWQPFEYYLSPFSKGAKGPMINWLAQQFATLDQQPQLLADQTFNSALSARIKIFQQHHQLLDDGVVGLKTLLKINEVLGIERGLITIAKEPLPQNQASTEEG
jgi:general secretion pathway protein A